MPSILLKKKKKTKKNCKLKDYIVNCEISFVLKNNVQKKNNNSRVARST